MKTTDIKCFCGEINKTGLGIHSIHTIGKQSYLSCKLKKCKLNGFPLSHLSDKKILDN